MTINELKDAIRLCIEGNRNVNVETYLVLKNGEINKLKGEIEKHSLEYFNKILTKF